MIERVDVVGNKCYESSSSIRAGISRCEQDFLVTPTDGLNNGRT